MEFIESEREPPLREENKRALLKTFLLLSSLTALGMALEKDFSPGIFTWVMMGLIIVALFTPLWKRIWTEDYSKMKSVANKKGSAKRIAIAYMLYYLFYGLGFILFIGRCLLSI